MQIIKQQSNVIKSSKRKRGRDNRIDKERRSRIWRISCDNSQSYELVIIFNLNKN